MTKHTNREWAYREASRRAGIMKDAYSIYKHMVHEDYIVRNSAAAPPNSLWELEATFQSGGLQSFKRT